MTHWVLGTSQLITYPQSIEWLDDTEEYITIKVGDWVCFKCDVEQSGKVIQIKQRTDAWNTRRFDYVLILENENGFIGGEKKTAVTTDQILELTNE